MAGNRITGGFHSYAGVEYDLYIYDADFVASLSTNPIVMGDPATGNVWGDPTTGAVWGWDAFDQLTDPPGIQTHILGLPGFSLEYETENEKLYTPLMPSRLTFRIMIESQTQELFLNALAESYEGQFLVRVLRNGDLFWTGTLMPDVVAYEDMDYPYEFELVAICGLSRLKSIEYPAIPTTGGTKQTLMTMVLNCLNELETEGFYAVGDDFFVNNLDWWETRHVAGWNVDPLVLTRVSNAAFKRKEDSQVTVYRFLSCYDVLFYICQMFGARLYQADGKWFMQNPSEYNLSVQSRRVYTKAGVMTYATGGQSYERECDQDNLARARGGRYEYLAPINKATVAYEFWQASNYIYGTGWDSVQPPTDTGAENFTIGEIGHNNGAAVARIQIRINHRIDYSGLEVYRETKHLFRLVLKIGSYYLKRHFATYSITDVTYDAMTWSATADYVDIWTEKVPLYDNQLMAEVFELITPQIPETGDAEINFYWKQCWDDTGTDVTPNGNLYMYWGTYEEELEILGDGSNYQQNSALEYSATNSTTGNSTNVELKSVLGDGPNGGVVSHLETYDGSTWDVSTLWGSGTGGARTKKLLELLASKIVSIQSTPRLKYVGSLINTTSATFFDPFHRLQIGTKYYVFLGGAFEAVSDTWTNIHLFHIQTELEPDTQADIPRS